MSPTERRNAILKMSHNGANLAVEEIASQFGVSRETVRRDLARLDDAGLLRRIHGGAVAPRFANEPPFQERQKLNMEAKRRIGLAAAALFEPGDSVMIDTGSTTEQFAAALSTKTNLTVITNSNRIAMMISAGQGKNRIFVLGGAFHSETGQNLGSLCIDQVEHFSADHAVLGVGAISADGQVMDYDVDEAMLARAMIARARTVTLLGDHSKFEHQALIKVCELESVARLVTDQAPSGQLEEALLASRVTTIVAPIES